MMDKLGPNISSCLEELGNCTNILNNYRLQTVGPWERSDQDELYDCFGFWLTRPMDGGIGRRRNYLPEFTRQKLEFWEEGVDGICGEEYQRWGISSEKHSLWSSSWICCILRCTYIKWSFMRLGKKWQVIIQIFYDYIYSKYPK